jgi:hypothetical protein
MATKKRVKSETTLVSVRLPKPLVERIEVFIGARIKETNASVGFNRTMAIQELLNRALNLVKF